MGVEPAVTAGRVRLAMPGEQTGAGLWIINVGTGPGCGFITTLSETAEVHPALLVTVKLYEPGLRPWTVVDVPVAVMMTLPGKRVSVQLPWAGSPLMTTLPVGKSQVGWVIAPATGGVGVAGCRLMVTVDDGAEVHPSALVTAKVKTPDASPVTVVLMPVPT